MSCEEIVPPVLCALGFTSDTRLGGTAILGPLCFVPGGGFWMGSSHSNDPDACVSERPASWMTLPSFWIGRHPVTIAEYDCAVREGIVPPPRVQMDHLPGNHPVAGVGWAEAVRYASFLTEVTGQHWSLPTEAQWERAARGDDRRRFPWGDLWTPTRANTWESGHSSVTAVGAYAGLGDSPFGVQDMAGNVWEWCSTLFRSYPYDAYDGREDPSSSYPRVLRGGAWRFSARIARVTYRYPDLPGAYAYDAVGFRLCCSIERP
jgi:formylglycine-generating enzyme required for sulfatase activity